MIHTTDCNHSYAGMQNLSYTVLCNAPYMDNLGKKIKDLREKKGLSQAAFGKECGKVSHVSVGKWESGDTKNIRLANLLAMAKFLQIPVSVLIDDPVPLQRPGTVDEPPGQAYGPVAPAAPPIPPLRAELNALIDQINDRGLILLIESAEQLAQRFPASKANPVTSSPSRNLRSRQG